MIGLPFANRGSVELVEKIKFAQQQTVSGMQIKKKVYESLYIPFHLFLRIHLVWMLVPSIMKISVCAV
jgi:hypothetical protein